MSDLNSNELPNVLVVTGVLDPAAVFTELHLPDGKIVRVATMLLQQEDAAFAADGTGPSGSRVGDRPASEAPIVVPLIEEQLEVGRRTLTTGTVRLNKTVHEFEAQLDEPLAVRTFDVERVLLNRPIESAPAVRQEGNTTIYPLIEEQLVLTKQLVLKEELRITRNDTERRDTQVVTLRREHITVERESAE